MKKKRTNDVINVISMADGKWMWIYKSSGREISDSSKLYDSIRLASLGARAFSRRLKNRPKVNVIKDK